MTKDDQAARTARSERRRWCPIGLTHQDEDDVTCGWTHEWPEQVWPGPHRLRIRRMLVCSECDQGYFNKEEFDEHECYSAY